MYVHKWRSTANIWLDTERAFATQERISTEMEKINVALPDSKLFFFFSSLHKSSKYLSQFSIRAHSGCQSLRGLELMSLNGLLCPLCWSKTTVFPFSSNFSSIFKRNVLLSPLPYTSTLHLIFKINNILVSWHVLRLTALHQELMCFCAIVLAQTGIRTQLSNRRSAFFKWFPFW